MTIQNSAAVRNAANDARETATGTAPKLSIWTGAQPANCAAANSGTKLWEEDLPSDWLSASSAGVKTLLGTWQANAVASGTAGHFRIHDTAATTCHWQGTVTATSGGGDIELQNTSIASGQGITITAFSVTEPNS